MESSSLEVSKDSILEEILAENQSLRAEIAKLKGVVIDPSYTISSLSSFDILDETPDRIKITGIMLGEGVWNGVLYTKDEIKKMYERYKEKLSSLPVKVEHGKTEQFKNKQVGKHTRAWWDDSLGAVLYEAEITDKDAIKLIKDGVLTATSITTSLKRLSLNSVDKGVDYCPIENSLTSSPACHCCVIVSKEELSSSSSSLKYYGVLEKHNRDVESIEKSKEVDIMENSSKENKEERKDTENKAEEYFELSEPMVLVLPEEKEAEPEEIELEAMSLPQALKRKRVIYEYLPPGKYPKAKKRTKRIPRYYYYYPYFDQYYPTPFYYWYYYPKISRMNKSLEKIKIPKLSRDELEKMVSENKARKEEDIKGTYYYYYPEYGYPEYGYPRYGYPAMYYYPYYYYDEKGNLIDSDELESIETNNEYKIVKNKRTGKYIVFKSTGKRGFGAWRIVKQFDTLDEAKAYVSSQLSENRRAGKPKSDVERVMTHYGVSEEVAKKLIDTLGIENLLPERGTGLQKIKCPVCGKAFDTLNEMIEHFNKEHKEKYGEFKLENEHKTIEKHTEAEIKNENKDNIETKSTDSSIEAKEAPIEAKEESTPKENEAKEETKEETQVEKPVEEKETPKEKAPKEETKEAEVEKEIKIKEKESPAKISVEEFLERVKNATPEEKAAIVADLLIRSVRGE